MRKKKSTRRVQKPQFEESSKAVDPALLERLLRKPPRTYSIEEQLRSLQEKSSEELLRELQAQHQATHGPHTLLAPDEDNLIATIGGVIVMLGVGSFVLWLTWPVWLPFAISIAVLAAVEHANRQRNSRSLDVAERLLFGLVICTGSISALHFAVILYDWWNY